MNSLGMPDNIQEADDEQLAVIKDIIEQLAKGQVWPFVDSKETVLKHINDEISRRSN